MKALFNLVLNENMKIYNRTRTWVITGILIAILIIASILIKNFGGFSEDNWKEQTQKEVEVYQKELANVKLPDFAKKELKQEIALKQYSLDHDIRPSEGTVWGNALLLSEQFIQLITLFVVIIAADSVAGEFTWGTIKMLLIRPASRAKILLSKYLATLLFALFLIAVLFIVSFLIGGILYGFGDTGLPHLYFENGEVKEGSLLATLLQTYGYHSVQLIMVVTIAFMISSVFRSSSLAIGLSIVTLFMGGGIAQVLRGFDWGKYYLFMNTDLTQYVNGTPLIEGMTLGFSIAILLVHFIIFNVLAWTIFMKRDVAA